MQIQAKLRDWKNKGIIYQPVDILLYNANFVLNKLPSVMNSAKASLSKKQLGKALECADLRVLLMVLYHFTADKTWLSDAFRPKRDVAIISDEDAGLSEEIQNYIKKCALELLASNNCHSKIDDPGNKLMQEMMSFCIGEKVEITYAPMMREMMGFTPRLAGLSRPQNKNGELHALIVGAGQSGIAMAQALNAIGLNYQILERKGDLGGTWNVNRYPGCGVDTPNHSYSWSFAKSYQWSRYFSKRSEIKQYLRASADEFGIYDHIKFNTEVISARWDDIEQLWHVKAHTNGQKINDFAVRFLISAVGQLNVPSIPKIDGIDSFKGEMFHTQQWPEDFSHDSKKIAIIGTGASAMQVVPEIAPQVEQLAIFQRTAQWVRKIPRYSEKISKSQSWLFNNVPYYSAWYRFTMLWRYGDTLLKFLERDPNWNKTDSVNKHNERHREQMVAHLRDNLAQRPELIEKCTPQYPPYGKRILLDNGWYDALCLENVHLNTCGVRKITTTGILDNEGNQIPLDAIIFSTGFKVTEMASGLGIVGRRGIGLKEYWRENDPTAYLGMHVSGFPNFFIMLGPNTSSGFGGSALFLSETQSHYIANCIEELNLNGIKSIDVKEESEKNYVKQVDAAHDRLIWTHPGLSTYYRNRTGRVFSITPWPLVDYWHRTRKLEIDKFNCRP